MSIYPFFEWCYNSALGTYVRDSSYAVPLVEVVHLIGLAMLLGLTAGLVARAPLNGCARTAPPEGESTSGVPSLQRPTILADSRSGPPG